eukprot:886-Heterococcus_DN1.PRE.2
MVLVFELSTAQEVSIATVLLTRAAAPLYNAIKVQALSCAAKGEEAKSSDCSHSQYGHCKASANHSIVPLDSVVLQLSVKQRCIEVRLVCCAQHAHLRASTAMNACSSSIKSVLIMTTSSSNHR